MSDVLERRSVERRSVPDRRRQDRRSVSNETEPGPSRNVRRDYWGMAVLIGAMTAVSALLLVLILSLVITGPAPTQAVFYETAKIVRVDDNGDVTIPQVEGFAAPSVEVADGEVPVQLSRCLDADIVDSVTGTAFTWFVSGATGERYQFSDGTSFELQPGCAAPRFGLAFPRPVLVEAADFVDFRDEDFSSWHLEGEYHFDDDQYENGAWRSETFLIVDSDFVTITGDE